MPVTRVRARRRAPVTIVAIAAIVMLAASAPLAAGQQATPAGTARFSANYRVYVRAAQVGRAEITLEQTPDGWTITSSGRMAPPIDLVTNSSTIRYSRDWQPRELVIDATLRGQPATARVTVEGGAARIAVSQSGQNTDRTAEIAPGTVLLPAMSWGAFEALAQRLRTATDTSTIPIFTLDAPTLALQVTRSQPETFKTTTRTIDARRSFVKFMTPAAPVDAEIWADLEGHLLRLSIPVQGLEVVRDDIASVAVRYVPISRPGDEEVRIPSLGFALAGTVSKPADVTGRLPTVILVGGSGPTDRDETVAGVPIFGQLAGALADRGFLVVRYDKRGVGQSGGRPESAGLEDFASDLRAVVKFMRDRKDVDRDRLAVVGHSEGGSVAMIAAAQDKKIRAIALLAAMGMTGVELNMWQVEHGLDLRKVPTAQHQETVALQRRIQEAVLTGQGWDGIPAQYRRQADTAWFRSFLSFKPETVLRKIKQPVLVIQGLLDKQVPPENADRFERAASARKSGRPPIEVVRVAGVNHLLLPAVTGEVEEYPTLATAHVSPAVIDPLVHWLERVFAPGAR